MKKMTIRNGKNRQRGVSPKKALAETIEELGMSATHKKLVEHAMSKYGIKFQFNLIYPK
jgi:hypothetical protein